MADEIHLTDDDDPEGERLLEELGRLACRLDPVPEEVMAAARDAFAWRSDSGVLAQLVEDSALHDGGPQPTEGGPRGTDLRRLTFKAPGLTVGLEVCGKGQHRRLLGHVVPPGVAEIEVRAPDCARLVGVDPRGWFVVDLLEEGPVSLRLRAAHHNGSPVTTDWVCL